MHRRLDYEWGTPDRNLYFGYLGMFRIKGRNVSFSSIYDVPQKASLSVATREELKKKSKPKTMTREEKTAPTVCCGELYR